MSKALSIQMMLYKMGGDIVLRIQETTNILALCHAGINKLV